MNKYMRAKKFQKYHHNERARAESLNKKEFRQYCTVILILLLCTVFYAICIHWNLFGLRDWHQRNEPVPVSQEGTSNTLSMEEPAAYIEHRVSNGETLWGIAERYHPSEDTRKVVWAVRAFNRTESRERMSAEIIPGQLIKVPMDVDAVEEVGTEQEATDLASRHDESSRDYGK